MSLWVPPGSEVGPGDFNREDIDPVVAGVYAAMLSFRSLAINEIGGDFSLDNAIYRQIVAESLGECSIAGILQDQVVPGFVAGHRSREEMITDAIIATDFFRFNRRVEQSGEPVLLIGYDTAMGGKTTGEPISFEEVQVGPDQTFPRLVVPTDGFTTAKLPNVALTGIQRGYGSGPLRSHLCSMRIVNDPTMVNKRINFVGHNVSFKIEQLWVIGADTILDYASKLAAVPLNRKDNPTFFTATLLETIAGSSLLALKAVCDSLGIDIKSDPTVKRTLDQWKHVAQQWKRGRSSTVEHPELYVLDKFKKFQASLPRKERSADRLINGILGIIG